MFFEWFRTAQTGIYEPPAGGPTIDALLSSENERREDALLAAVAFRRQIQKLTQSH